MLCLITDRVHSGRNTSPATAAHAIRIGSGTFQRKSTARLTNRISDNVGGVKHFSSTLHPALKEERHFALVEGFAFPTVGSLVIVFRSGHSVRPMHLFGL